MAVRAPNMTGDYDESIRRVTDLGLDARAERAIFATNAERFLRVRGSSSDM